MSVPARNKLSGDFGEKLKIWLRPKAIWHSLNKYREFRVISESTNSVLSVSFSMLSSVSILESVNLGLSYCVEEVEV